ncbi:MAG TPA: 16S rRNA (guanine(527)-N(7))-methyltransferase RsmG [Clostridia bacterium]|nr:16S rRNA (guanine(527)-N(7))-methyltransferase RsmG [Clostridia bacterium]
MEGRREDEAGLARVIMGELLRVLDEEPTLEFVRYKAATLAAYGAKVLRATTHRDLVGNISPEGMARDHLLDSLALFVFEDVEENAALVDVGSGAGFPGVPLGIVREDLSVTALEVRKKRAEFLRETKREMGLFWLETVELRAEIAGRNPKMRERFDWAVARAVGLLPEVLEYCLPLVKVGGKAVLWRGRAVASEVEEAERVSRELGGRVCRVHEYGSQAEGGSYRGPEGKRALLVIRKVENTPQAYPRGVGVPRKRPLK